MNTNRTSGFRMSKWYLDCVTEAGHVSMAYTGSIKWGPVRLHYSSLLDGSGLRDSLMPHKEPFVDNSVIRWSSGALDVDAEWTPDAAELRETVFESAEGSIEWHCLAPRAWARMGQRAGLGYVEQLVMTIAPWQRLFLRSMCCGRSWSRACIGLAGAESLMWP